MKFRYAFVGLPPSERTLLETLFEIDAKQSGTGIVRVNKLVQADLLVVNGDDLAVVRKVRQENPIAMILLVVASRKQLGQIEDLKNLLIVKRPLKVANVRNVFDKLTLAQVPSEEIDTERPSDFGATFFVKNSEQSSEMASVELAANYKPSRSSLLEEYRNKERLAFAPTTATAPLDVLPANGIPANQQSAPQASLQDTVQKNQKKQLQALKEQRAKIIESTNKESIKKDLIIKPAPQSKFDSVLNELAESRSEVLVVSVRRADQPSTLVSGIKKLGIGVSLITDPAKVMNVIEVGFAKFVFLDQSTLGGQIWPLVRMLNGRKHAQPTGGQSTFADSVAVASSTSAFIDSSNSKAGTKRKLQIVIVSKKQTVIDGLHARMSGCKWLQTPIEKKQLQNYFEEHGLKKSKGSLAPVLAR